MTDPVEQIRARAALVAGNPDVVKVQSVRDRQVLLDRIVELEAKLAVIESLRDAYVASGIDTVPVGALNGALDGGS